jgi:hypothetical protein
MLAMRTHSHIAQCVHKLILVYIKTSAQKQEINHDDSSDYAWLKGRCICYRLVPALTSMYSAFVVVVRVLCVCSEGILQLSLLALVCRKITTQATTHTQRRYCTLLLLIVYGYYPPFMHASANNYYCENTLHAEQQNTCIAARV